MTTPALPLPDSYNAAAATAATPQEAARLVELGELAEHMGIELLELSPDFAVATMPVAGNRQPLGVLNGGASAVLAETVASIAARLHAFHVGGHAAVGVDLSITHHRPVREGLVRAEATALHRGRTTACYEIVLSDAAARRTATARLTLAVLRGA
ncbi:MAG: hotdog fold thioesterase [Buchananella hordeovulneris]|nr:hotdog fold thioesterase [Buchananella hordeovulneris]